MKRATPTNRAHRTLQLAATVWVMAVLSLPSTSMSQVGMGSRFPVEYRTWETKDSQGDKETISQFYVPVITTVRVSPAANLVFSSSGARIETSSPTADNRTVNGLTDLKAQLFYAFGPGNQFLVLGGIDVPTGKTELTLEEFQVTRAAAAPLLGMRQRSFGGGFDVNGGLGWSTPITPQARLALAAGVTIPGSFGVLQGIESTRYRPAPHGSVSLGVELRSARWEMYPRALSLKATARTYGTDRADDLDVFEEGDQVEVSLSAKSDLGPILASVRSRTTIKADNTQLTSSEDALTQAVNLSAGSGTFVQIGARWARSTIQPGLDGQWRWVTDDQVRSRNGYTLGLGPAISGSIGETNWFKVGFLYLQGRAGEGERKSDLSGFAVSANFVWRMF